jgi:hypothetical protein
MLASLTLRIHGRDGLEPLIGVASMAIGVSVFLFGWLVMANARPPRSR